VSFVQCVSEFPLSNRQSVFAWTNFDIRIDQAGGADNLFHENTSAFLQFVWASVGADKNNLFLHCFPFIERQWPIIER